MRRRETDIARGQASCDATAQDYAEYRNPAVWMDRMQSISTFSAVGRKEQSGPSTYFKR
ncbi:hypothetical protein LLE49_00800 [Alicyclobacillus tolerans]|uniref:hypothetical protein n=1 Tax=Alicyclobacillus tolerans TaxID=90970 RepID=UPI001F28C672|nr:hypothetical protein [Alicyclobacillus tolerans]MCF8563283.1 hypothetical protein [Alicyclobacillus tolerans]